MKNDETNPWKTLSSSLKYENPWIKVTEHSVIHPSGNPGIYGTIHFKNHAIGIIPVDNEQHTWLVGQYRYPLERYSWEIPEGGGKRDVDPLVSAQRELREETGLIAKKWTPLLTMDLSNSVSDEKAFLFLAEDLTPGPSAPDETEALTLRRLPLKEAIQMVHQGEITDALAVAGLLLIQHRFRW